ncbi:MAG: FkbM family methyltransferase [Aggregatilineales bacterium]
MNQIYYHQETEIKFLQQLLEKLDNKIAIDVGAEKGSVTQALLDAGSQAIYAFEPFPTNVSALRQKYNDESRVKIFDFALGLRDETVNLHIAEDKTGQNGEVYHSLLAHADTPTIHWAGQIPVQCRSLASLLAQGLIPPNVGILKIDTEGNDLAILQGMGQLSSAVVMVEYWDDLPQTVGQTPYSIREVVEVMQPRGFSNFAVIKREDEVEIIQVNSARSHSGQWGNIVFIHDDVFARLAPLLYEAVVASQENVVNHALMFQTESKKRLALIDEQAGQIAMLQRADDEHLALIDEQAGQIAMLQRAVDERLSLVDEQAGQIAMLQRAVDERLTLIDEQAGQIAMLQRAVDERLALIEFLDEKLQTTNQGE